MAEHAVEIVSKFFADGWTAECSCGWRSDEMATSDGALVKSREHLFDVRFVPTCDTEGS